MSEVRGFEQLEANFNALSYGVQRHLLMKATRDGSEVIRAELERRAPVLPPSKSTAKRFSGALAHGMMYRIFDSSTAEVTARIGPEKTTFWGLYSEFGTEKEKAAPWMRPGFDDKQAAALEAVGLSLWSGIQRLI